MAQKEPLYVGLNTSLYNTLNAQQILYLERSIWLRRIGRHEEALEIYTKQLVDAEDIPVVIIEHAGIYLETRRYGRLYRFVDSHLTRKASSQETLDQPEWRLLAIMKAMVVVRHKGIVEPAIDEVKRMQQWLKDLPVTEYTDVQVLVLPVFHITQY